MTVDETGQEVTEEVKEPEIKHTQVLGTYWYSSLLERLDALEQKRAGHKFFRTSMRDSYQNFLFTCSCKDGNVTGSEGEVRSHCAEMAVNEQFAGDVEVTATGFKPVERLVHSQESEDVEFKKRLRQYLEIDAAPKEHQRDAGGTYRR